MNEYGKLPGYLLRDGLSSTSLQTITPEGLIYKRQTWCHVFLGRSRFLKKNITGLNNS